MMNAIIINAINNKQLLQLQYHGYSRTVEPHTYGINKKGNEVISCYQVAGGSESNERQGWKLLLVEEARAITSTASAFLHARNGYKRDSETMPHIYAQL